MNKVSEVRSLDECVRGLLCKNVEMHLYQRRS